MREVTAEMIERGRPGDARAVERRKRERKVREVRAKLTSVAIGETAFEADLIRIYAAACKSAAMIAISIALAIAGMSAFWLPWQRPAQWLGGVTVTILFAALLKWLFLRRAEGKVVAPVWRRRFIFAEGLQSIAWASIVGFFVQWTPPYLPIGGPGAKTFLLVSMLLIGAMNAVTAATVPRAVFAAVLPTMIATLATAWHGLDDGTNVALTMFACGTQLFFIVLAGRLHQTTLGEITFRGQKDELIAELEQAKAVSDEARRRAEEANLAKSRFLATMSHELRTPLNAILGFSEVMKSELFGPHVVASYKEYAGDIHSSGQHLLQLINEILDLSRIEAGRYELKEDAISLASIIDDCRHLLTLRARKRDIAIVETIEPDLPRIWADERAMRQVILNLLTNAIKFTPPGGQITIKVGWTGSGGQYASIRDTGPGIPDSEMAIVMSSFGRGTLAQKNADEGSGLGLPIVKGLVELHGGSFTLNSVLREGTEAIVVLPPARVMDALPRMEVKEPVKRRPAA